MSKSGKAKPGKYALCPEHREDARLSAEYRTLVANSCDNLLFERERLERRVQDLEAENAALLRELEIAG